MANIYAVKQIALGFIIVLVFKCTVAETGFLMAGSIVIACIMQWQHDLLNRNVGTTYQVNVFNKNTAFFLSRFV